MYWTVSIDDGLNKRFREIVFRVKVFRRDTLKEALEEAIRLWLKRNTHGNTEQLKPLAYIVMN